MPILKHLLLKNRKQPMQKKFVATAVGYVPWEMEPLSIFIISTNMKTVQESVKNLMAVSITKYLRMRTLAPKRK
ncbi:hypothetical protein BM1374165_01000 [Bartonella henselae]|uniref:Uncharacterized protein n=1 Tax=Bartonella henselae TaxID=38323 RepID=X5MHJ4_BARHN|nr:hypothetical protein BM1374165_01000 [Bartonella henselae]